MVSIPIAEYAVLNFLCGLFIGALVTLVIVLIIQHMEF